MDQKAHLIEQTLLKEQQTHDKWFQQWSEQRELRIIHQKRQEMSTKELFDL
jgi:hypothetical protein